jgi:phosphatidylserine decarboxylase
LPDVCRIGLFLRRIIPTGKPGISPTAKMVKEGFPFVIVPLALAIIFGAINLWAATFAFIGLTLFMVFFFRDPMRTAPDQSDIVVSAADGRVTRIEDNDNEKLVSVFLSPLDVHINRAPIAGRIISVKYTRGRKVPATRNEASLINERNSLVIQGERLTVTCTQIAGILARRIVCWNGEGDNLTLGQKFGLIKFSSRTDVRMPGNVEISVKIGDKVRGGETIIARIAENDMSAPGADAGTAVDYGG